MKILWVKAGGLVPPDVGGRIRSYNILRELAKRHAVTFFSFYARHPDDRHGELERVFDRVVCLPLSIPVPRSRGEVFHFARHVFSTRPYSVAKHCRPEVARALRNLLATESYDVIVCDFVVPAAVIPWDYPCLKILFTHNVESLIWKRHLQAAKTPIWKAVCWREYQTMLRFERWCLSTADHVLTVSEADRELLSHYIPGQKMTVIPTGVDVDYFQPGEQEEHPNSLVFTGAMDWLPNEDGILFFVGEVLPFIRRQIPDVSLAIVGREPSARIRALADEHVRVTGRVEDIRPFVREGSVYVVPLRIGSGTRLKIFEAMAMGKAIVSTTIGAEGLPVTDGEHLLLADTAEQLAAKVVALLRNRPERKRLGSAAHQLVQQRHSWASVASQFEAVLASLIRHRSVAGANKPAALPEVAVR